MKTIAIIGGTGMLGQPVAKQLQHDGFQVRILSRQPSKARQQLGERFDYRLADLTNVASLKAALSGVDAVHINVRGHDKASHNAQHVQGTHNILAALKGRKLDLISMISSASAHPEFNNRWDNRSKWEAEQLLKQSEHPYLSFMPSWFMETLPMFVQKKRLVQIGPSTRPIHWVAANDYAREVSRALKDARCRHQRLAIYGPEGLTMSDAFSRYAQQFNLKHMHLPAWFAKAVGYLTRDLEMIDIADLTVHYDRTGEKQVPGIVRTTTTLQPMASNASKCWEERLMSQSLWLELALRTVHFLGIFGLVGGLVTENVLLKKTLPVNEIKRLVKIDSLYGLSALVVLVAGLLLWLGVGKPSAFYSQNPVFLIKLTLFVCVALASLFPTVYFSSESKK